MQQTRYATGLTEFARVSIRIQAWRAMRAGRSGGAMPEELWRSAVALARVHGPGPTARQLRIDRGSLKKRLIASESTSAGAGCSAFVDVGAAGELLANTLSPRELGQGGVVIELALVTGERMTVRLPATYSLDVMELVRELRGRR